MRDNLVAPDSDSDRGSGQTSSEEGRDPFERVADEYVRTLRRGESASVEEWVRRHPELADEIRRLFPTLEAMESLNRAESGTLPDCIGDYTILREVGRGGMGIVYEGRHAALRRHAAVKILPQDLATDSAALRRFQREARAAARLQHSHIVPVYEVGHDGERQFYAMQFVNGVSLARLIELRRRRRGADDNAHIGFDSRPEPDVDTAFRDWFQAEERDWDRRVAEMGRDAAAALQYAHEQGVLHRDVKPSNVMLDQSGTVWILDFGLARIDDPEFTRTRSLAGTLRYMPPERFRGWCDPRSDVYSLGLTLYELLTLRPAFSESDTASLTQQISESVPTQPRQIRGSIAADLETIVLKAVEKEPADRYESAEALADDLNRFLEQRPVRARRTALPGRLLRWCRRNRRVAALALTLVVVLLCAGVASFVGMLQFRAQAVSLAEQQDLLVQRQAELRSANERVSRNLFRSLVNESQARRLSQRPGQRVGSLSGIQSAVALLSEASTADDLLRLRNEAVAAMALADIEPVHHLNVDGLLSGWSMSPDFRRLACEVSTGDGARRVRVLDIDAQATLWESLPFRTQGIALNWSPDGRLLVVTLSGQDLAEVRDAATGDVQFTAICKSSQSVSFHPTEPLLAVPQANGDVLLYDIEQPAAMTAPQRIRTESPHPVSVRFHPHEPLLFIWNPVDAHTMILNRETLHRRGITICDSPLMDLEVHPDGDRLAVGAVDFSATLWNRRTESPDGRLEGHAAEVVDVEFSPGGRLLATSSWDQTTRLWSTDSGRLLLVVDGRCQFSRREPLLALRRQESIRICRVADGREFRVLTGHSGGKGPRALDLSPDGEWLASAGDDGVRIWQTASLRSVVHLQAGSGQSVHFVPDGSGLLTAGHGELRLWPAAIHDSADGSVAPSRNVRESRLLGRSAVHPTRFFTDVARTGLIAWTSDYGQIRTGHVSRPEGPELDCPASAGFLALSPDGRWLAVADETPPPAVSVHDVTTGRLHHRLPLPGGRIRCRFSPGSRQLVTGVPAEYRIHDVESGALLRVLPRGFGLHGAMAWTADGRLLALASGSIELYDGRTFELLAVLEAPVAHGIVTDLELTPNGDTLFAAYESHEIHRWDLAAIRRQLSDLGLNWAD